MEELNVGKTICQKKTFVKNAFVVFACMANVKEKKGAKMKDLRFRIWVKGKFYYWGFLDMGFGLYFSGPPSIGGSPLKTEETRESSEQFIFCLENGKEVWEGDIVKAQIYSDEVQVLVVRKEKGCFVIDFEDAENDIVPIEWFVGTLEVIGNVHENPELIKREGK